VFGIAELARSFSAEAIEELAAIMRARDLPPRARIAAIDSILDRDLGKPMQPVQQQYLARIIHGGVGFWEVSGD
jgi:hypothetical protein